MLSDSLPNFDRSVTKNGYRWWYVDGVSDCGNYGLVMIAFIGSVFSPYYYRARQRGLGDPRQYCAINVASYGRKARAWSMTERGASQLQTSSNLMRIGANELQSSGDELQISVDDRTAPWLRRIEGRVTVRSNTASDTVFFLDAAKRHEWQPVAPVARIEVELRRPDIRWSGNAYLDTNGGTRALEDDFLRWHWSSLRERDASHIFYDVTERNGERNTVALAVDADNRVRRIDAPVATPLAKSGWRVARESQHGADTTVIKTLEDSPFYARSLLKTGRDADAPFAMHESLSMQRFTKPWVRMLLPFRMPRVTF